MITLVFKPITDTTAFVKIGGDSTDSKPGTVNGYSIAASSVFVEADTGKEYLYSPHEADWVEVTGGGSYSEWPGGSF